VGKGILCLQRFLPRSVTLLEVRKDIGHNAARGVRTNAYR